MGVHVVSLELERQEKAGEERFLDPAAMDGLKLLCLEKIRHAAASSGLIRSQDFIRLLYVWREWGQNADEVRRYLDAFTATPEGTLRLLQKFVLKSRSHTIGDYVSRTHWYVRLSVLEPFVSVEAVQRVLAGVDKGALSDEDARAVSAFEKAVQRHAQGKPEDDPFSHDD